MKSIARVSTFGSICLLAAWALAGDRSFSSVTPETFPGSATSVLWTGAVNNFSNPGNVTADDDVRSSVDPLAKTYKLVCNSFSFSGIDSNDRVDGIRVTFNGYQFVSDPASSSPNDPVYGGYVTLLDDTGAEVSTSLKGILTNPFLTVFVSPTTPSDSARTLGGSTDLWGQTSGFWDGKVTDPDFGFDVWFNYTNARASTTLNIDSVTVKLWYTSMLTGERKVTESTGRVSLVSR